MAGLGLFQDRFEPVAMGLLVLALTYSLILEGWRTSKVLPLIRGRPLYIVAHALGFDEEERAREQS